MELLSLSSLAVFGLGLFHGLNPGMGWLFAVARGMQENSRAAVWRALGPLALGHALAILTAVGLAVAVGVVLPAESIRWIAGAGLIALGISRLVRHRHPRSGGMRVSAAGLTFWSFLMASAHGAGLMVLPFVIGGATVHASEHVAHAALGHISLSITDGVIATVVHAVAYLATTGALAVVVFERTGLGLLRRAWINVDLIWAAALVVTGICTCLI